MLASLTFQMSPVGKAKTLPLGARGLKDSLVLVGTDRQWAPQHLGVTGHAQDQACQISLKSVCAEPC